MPSKGESIDSTLVTSNDEITPWQDIEMNDLSMKEHEDIHEKNDTTSNGHSESSSMSTDETTSGESDKNLGKSNNDDSNTTLNNNDSNTNSDLPHKNDSNVHDIVKKKNNQKKYIHDGELLTNRIYSITKLLLKHKEGLQLKKTSVVPIFFAAHQTSIMRRLLWYIFSKKSDKIFSKLIDPGIIKFCGRISSLKKLVPYLRLFSTKKGGKPKLMWNKTLLTNLFNKTTKQKNITTLDVADAIKKDPIVSAYITHVEIPFGANNSSTPLETKQELLQLKRESEKQERERLKRKRDEIEKNNVHKKSKRSNKKRKIIR